jgi:hypothetical protein
MNTSLNFEKLTVISAYNEEMTQLNLCAVTNMANSCKGFMIAKNF